MMKDRIVKHILRTVLALAIVLSASVFISQDVDASCWTKTKEGWGTCACDGTEYAYACWGNETPCIYHCDGHEYPSDINPYEFFGYRYREIRTLDPVVTRVDEKCRIWKKIVIY